MRSCCTPIRMAKIQSIDNTKSWQQEISTLLARMFNGTASLENSLAVSQNYTYSYYTIWLTHSLVFIQRSWTHTHTKTCMDVYLNFIHNCHNLEATEMSFSRWINKLWHIQTEDYYSALKMNELSSYERSWQKLRYISSERSQCEKVSWFKLYDILRKMKLWRE